ncbi:MAG: patatin-like phospholipase family protein [archaeon]
MAMFQRKKIGVALSSGGSRGLAHIGVLEILEKNKIPIDMIAGTSMGALIGALYAIEPNAKKIEKKAIGLKDQSFFDYTFPRHGLIKGKKIEEILKNLIGDIEFKDLKIPLYITAFDLKNNREIIFHRGDVTKAVRASISIPGIFIPIINKGRILVDGAVADPIPTEILRERGADIVIAVNVNHLKTKKPIMNAEAIPKQSQKGLPSIYQSAMRSLHIRECELSEADLFGDKADVVININLEKIDGFDFSKTKILIQKGRYSTRRYLKEIRNASEHPFKEFLESLKEDLGVKEIVKSVKKVQKELGS